MQLDQERADRFKKELGPGRLAVFLAECTAIANGAAPQSDAGFVSVGDAARKVGLPPEDLLIAARVISHESFRGAPEPMRRIEAAWPQMVRAMMSGYFSGRVGSDEVT